MASCGSHPEQRKRLLMTAYHYDRAYSMESRLSWQRAQHAAQEYDVTVITARPELDRSGSDVDRPVDVVLLPLNRLERLLMSLPGSYYLGYRLWHRRVFRQARQLHAERSFDLAHHVSFCGYREPSDLWKLGVPFVWGPIGGTQAFPVRFLGQLGMLAAFRELLRNVANFVQLRFGARVRRAAKQASAVLAANREVARDLAKTHGVRPLVQLETGVEPTCDEVRPRRDSQAPLRILWSGRLQPWKGLPLLLEALAQLPEETRYTFRVLGQGPCGRCWRRLARRLGVDAHVQWMGWPDYREQLPHYEWADVFVFTSLRDTSGTGLLEALAAGAAIVGLNHQGAADIMSEECAIAVDVSSPRAAIRSIAQAIERLSADPELLHDLSAGAIERAKEFSWDRQWEVMRAVYERALRETCPTNRATPIRIHSPAEPAPCLVEAC
jgi:glycosyltransferase involved in cell wall biosynthesis